MLCLGLLQHAIFRRWKMTGLNWRSQRDGSGRCWCITVGIPNGRGVTKGCNGIDLGIWLIRGRICEGTRKCFETTDNAVFWCYQRGSDGLMEELHRTRDFLGLIIVWGDTLADIIIQGHTNTPSHLASKFPIIENWMSSGESWLENQGVQEGWPYSQKVIVSIPRHISLG